MEKRNTGAPFRASERDLPLTHFTQDLAETSYKSSFFAGSQQYDSYLPLGPESQATCGSPSSLIFEITWWAGAYEEPDLLPA